MVYPYTESGEAIYIIRNEQGVGLAIACFDLHNVKLDGLPNGSKWSHEEEIMSTLKMVHHIIVDSHNIDIDHQSLKKVKEMFILANSEDSDHKRVESSKEKRFLVYDMFANGIDDDKFDYIVRDDSRSCGLGCNFQDMLVRVYSKVSEAFQNFQLRAYGIQTQIGGLLLIMFECANAQPVQNTYSQSPRKTSQYPPWWFWLILGLGLFGVFTLLILYVVYVLKKYNQQELIQQQRTAFVESFPACTFISTEGATCSICLDDFVLGDNLRLLPRCNHLYHIDCIGRYWAVVSRPPICPYCRRDYTGWPDDIVV